MGRNDSSLWIRWTLKNLKYHGRKHAEEYDESDQTLFYSSDHVTIRNWLLDHLKIENKKINRLLDMGCGTGRWFHVMKNADFVLGVDFSVEMLNKAKEKIEGEKHTNLNLVRGDIFNLPLKRSQFDCVVSLGVLAEHAPLNDDVFEEVGHVLKSGGSFLFTAQKIGRISKLKIKTAQLLWRSFKENFEFSVKTFHTRFNHSEKTIKELANRHDFNVQEIKIKALTKSNFYFVCAQKGSK